jgi:hypothetical protein
VAKTGTWIGGQGTGIAIVMTRYQEDMREPQSIKESIQEVVKGK